MSTAAEVLGTARAHGVTIEAEGDRLILEWDEDDAFPPELLAAMKEHKAGLLRILSGRSAPTPEAAFEVEKTRTPDQARGKVLIMNEHFSCRAIQSPVQPIPDWCYCWAQEGDEAWTYTQAETHEAPEE